MKTYILAIVSILLFSLPLTSQEIVSYTLQGSKTKQEIINLFGLSIVQYGADYYRVTYTSVDARGDKDTLSGLMMIPQGEGLEFPMLVYQHGTSDCKACVPSNYGKSGGEEGQLGLIFAGLGYISILPDYVGMGDGRGFQTYVHDATTFTATEDMYLAVKSLDLTTNDQLFITGYSQGGYGSMSFHKGMQEKYGASSVTAAAHLSGPYSLSGVMRDLVLSDDIYLYVAYIPNILLGFNEVYEIYDDLTDFFKPEYVPDILRYYNGEIGLTDLNIKQLQMLVNNTGVAVAKGMIRDDVLEAIENDPEHIINQVLRENDLFRWVPESPTRIFYCKADDQVPYLNSLVTRDSMYALGANPSLVIANDVNPTADHGGCVNPALTQTLLFFASLQNITVGTFNKATTHHLRLYPNPAQNKVYVEISDINPKEIMVWDISGQQKEVDINPRDSYYEMDVTHLEDGMYLLMVRSEDGSITSEKLVVKR